MLADITPHDALNIAGEQPRRKGSRLVAGCPSCGHELDIVSHAFICESSGCSFSRGGSLDYLACKLGSYREAIAQAGQISPHFAAMGDFEIEQYKADRALVDFFITQENKAYESDVSRLDLKQSFGAATNVSPNAFERGHLYLTADDSNRLVLLLALAGITPPSNLQNRPVIVAPYWAFPHVISQLVVFSSTLKNLKVCDVHPHRYAWFGLSHKNVHCDRVSIFPSYVEAMAQESIFKLNDPYTFPTHLHVDVKKSKKGLIIPEMTFHGSRDTWASTLPLWSFMDGFDTATFKDHEAGSMSLPDLMELNLTRTAQDGFTAFLDLCSALNMDPVTRARLMVLAEKMHDRSRASRLKENLTHRLLDCGDKYSIYESAEGYEIEIADQRRMLTNFTLRLDSVVGFTMLSGLHYQGQLVIGGAVIPFDFPSSYFETPSVLEKKLQAYHALHVDPEASREGLASIKDTNKADFKKVLSWLKHEASKLPRSRGIRMLGWSRRCDTFTTPDVLVDSGGIREGLRYYPDPDGDHHCYTSGSPLLGLPEETPNLDPAFAEVISALVAQMIRYYHGHQVRPLAVINNEEGRNKGLRIFRGLGQTSLLRFTGILPANLELNRGMPCLFGGVNNLQATKMQFAGLWLSDSGFDLGAVSDDQIDTASSILPGMLAEVARRILAGELNSYRERKSVMAFTGQAVEGAAVIRAEFWPDWPEAGVTWSAVDKLLAERARELQVQAVVDEVANRVLLPATLWQGLGFNRADLALELGQLCETIEHCPEDQSILVDRDSTYRFLDAFYGKVPKLVNTV